MSSHAAGVRCLRRWAVEIQAADRKRGGLAPWQIRCATELMIDRLGEDMSLSEAASACGLSPNYFARAFKQSVGMPPHRWLLRQRVLRAKSLLRGAERSLREIASACGFADQSHFTRVFTGVVGASPGAWRKRTRSNSSQSTPGVGLSRSVPSGSRD